MSQLGLGVMIRALMGYSGEHADKYLGRTITAADITDDRLRLAFDDGVKIEIHDSGQSCCEHRYMSTDDELSSLIGRKLVRIEAKPGPDIEAGGEEHETCFVEIGVDDGFVTLVNHNEHNGYYGGFALNIREVS